MKMESLHLDLPLNMVTGRESSTNVCPKSNRIYRSMTEWLLARGAYPNKKAKDGMTPLLAAVQMGEKEATSIDGNASIEFFFL